MNKNDKDKSVTRSYIIGGIGVIALISALILSWFLDTDTFDKGDITPDIVTSGQQTASAPDQQLATDKSKDTLSVPAKVKKTSPTDAALSDTKTEKQRIAETRDQEQATDIEDKPARVISQANTISLDSSASSEQKDETATPAESAPVAESDKTKQEALKGSPDSEGAQAAEIVSEEITFDVVRISPDGNAVLAGKSGANQKLELYDGDNLLGTTESDEQGNWVFVPQDPLAVGQHHIVLKKRIDADTLLDTGTDVLAVTIEAPKANEEDQKPLAMLLPQAPDKAVKLVQSPVENETPTPLKKTVAADLKTVTNKPQRVFPLVVLQLDILANGQWKVQGTGMGESRVRYYLDAEYQADMIIPPEGQSIENGRPAQWSLSGDTALTEGNHILRLDLLAGDDGKVVERQEIMLSYRSPAPTKPTKQLVKDKDNQQVIDKKADSAKPKVTVEKQIAVSEPVAKVVDSVKPPSPPVQSAPAPLAIPTAEQLAGLASQMPAGQNTDLSAVRVINIRGGDNLWKIARQTYGQGIAYTYIFNANQRQIQNPDLIYPGQIFVLPVLKTDP